MRTVAPGGIGVVRLQRQSDSILSVPAGNNDIAVFSFPGLTVPLRAQCRAMHYTLHRILILCLAAFAWACNGMDPTAEEPASPYAALREEAAFPVGVALQARHLNSADHTRVVGHVFSSITAEYEMNMVPLSTGPGAYAWEAADRLVDFAASHQMQVHGHALAWHQTTPAWLENLGGTDEEFEAEVRDYIMEVMGRYKGSVRSWDVVNEAVEDGTGALRNSVFRRRMGDDFVVRLFEYARQADPGALLFYNDYGSIWDENKRSGILAVVDQLMQSASGIDGVGLQRHVSYNWPPIANIQAMMDEIVRRGLLVHVSEFDVRVNPDGDLSSLRELHT